MVVYSALKDYNKLMEIPYFIFLIIYLVGVLVYFFFAFFNIYHIIRFGFFDFSGKLNTFLYFGIILGILVITFLLLSDIDWFNTLSLDFGGITDFDFKL